MDALEMALPLIREFEGCRLRAYRDIIGVWTLGWGETLGVKPGMVWTQEQADAQLERRVAAFMGKVLKACPQLYLEPPQRLAACTSLAYNIGIAGFSSSSVCRLTKRGEYTRAADSFLLWNKAGGQTVAGLTRRRKAERELYLK